PGTHASLHHARRTSTLLLLTGWRRSQLYTLSLHDALPIFNDTNISIAEMAELSKRILDIKTELSTNGLSHESLINMFRIGTSARSEEHTSELQSRENLVCRLLLEKKKNNMIREAPSYTIAT